MMRLPIVLHRNVFRDWTVSEEVVAHGELKELNKTREGYLPHAEYHAQLRANWKATQDADYRLRRDYAKVKGEEK